MRFVKNCFYARRNKLMARGAFFISFLGQLTLAGFAGQSKRLQKTEEEESVLLLTGRKLL